MEGVDFYKFSGMGFEQFDFMLYFLFFLATDEWLILFFMLF